MQAQTQLRAIDRRPLLYLPTSPLQHRMLMLQVAPFETIQNTGLATPLRDQVNQRLHIGTIATLEILTAT